MFACDSSNYLDQVAEEINDTLQESGQVIISELSKTFTLSTDFLLEVKWSTDNLQCFKVNDLQVITNSFKIYVFLLFFTVIDNSAVQLHSFIYWR